MPEHGVYLDHAATTPVDPRVLEAMLPFFSERFGNPSSVYALGRDARSALDWARGTTAACIGADPSEIVFTSGATEANNAVIKGVAWRSGLGGAQDAGHVVVSAIEHPSVLQAAAALRAHGFTVSLVPCQEDGIVSLDAVREALRPDTCLVSIMLANNEIGTIQPIADIASVTRARNIPLHTDATQAAAWMPIDVDDLGVDFLTLSAHKFYGPKGVGALFAREGSPILWQQHGGAQEDTRRGGTENVPSIVGLAVALGLAINECDQRATHALALRERLAEALLERVPDTRLNGHPAKRLPNNVNVSFSGVEGDVLLMSLDLLGVAASSGSACSTGSTEPSHVLRAIGLDDALARGSLRLTLGKDNTQDDVDRAIAAVVESVARARASAGVASR